MSKIKNKIQISDLNEPFGEERTNYVSPCDLLLKLNSVLETSSYFELNNLSLSDMFLPLNTKHLTLGT